jgi:hypothetical protein
MSKTINQNTDLRNYEVIEEQVDGGYVYTMQPVVEEQGVPHLTKEEIEWNSNKALATDA